MLVRHNAAEQSTVLWMRILAAEAGPIRSKVIVVDPRRPLTVSTETGRAVLDDLVRARFLRLTDDGTYLRAADDKSFG